MIIDRIFTWAKGVWQKMIGTQTIKDKLRVDISVSDVMQQKIALWAKMYVNEAPWLDKDVRSLNLPAAIAGEIARAVTIEMEMLCEGSPRADYLAEQMKPVLSGVRQFVEYGEAKGGIVLKPYPDNDRIAVDYVQADAFFPVKFDALGNIIDAVFVDQRQVGKKYYTKLEHHYPVAGGYAIENMAYRSESQNEIGGVVALDVIEDWAGLAPYAEIENIDKPLFAYFKAPFANNIDPNSSLGVSCYARAENLIEDADRQWSNLLWEFESGKRAVYADIAAFRKDKNGNPVLPDNRLYRTLNDMEEIGKGELFKEWSPAFREASIQSGLDTILKKIEFNCGLAYGTISDPQTVEKTATEITAAKQRSYSTVVDSQKSLEAALTHLVWAADVYATLYSLAPAGVYNLSFDFDDSIVVDREAQMAADRLTVTMGGMPMTIFLQRNYGLDEATAEKWVAMVQAQRPTDEFQGA